METPLMLFQKVYNIYYTVIVLFIVLYYCAFYVNIFVNFILVGGKGVCIIIGKIPAHIVGLFA